MKNKESVHSYEWDIINDLVKKTQRQKIIIGITSSLLAVAVGIILTLI